MVKVTREKRIFTIFLVGMKKNGKLRYFLFFDKINRKAFSYQMKIEMIY